MHDDIRPAGGPRPSSSPQTNTPEADNSTQTPEQPTAVPNVSTPETTEPVDEDKIEAMLGPSPGLVIDTPTIAPKKIKKYRVFRWHATKRQLILYGTLTALLLIAITSSYIILQRPAEMRYVPPPKKVVVKPTTVASTLTGLQVDPAVNQRPVIGVMIENSADARPQAGLKDAGVVFEAIAEGGITRFLALFQDTQPSYVGPVRSARPYYEQWALGFDAGYAHVGGSPEALRNIKRWGVRDLDQFYNSSAYHRISTRYAPHNMYTSIPKLSKLAASKGYTTSKYTGFARKKEVPAKQPNARTITMNFSSAFYNTRYVYDAASNSYKRSEGGTAHRDDKSKVQLSPKVVIALIMPYGLESDGYHSTYKTLGSGSMFVFQDGIVTKGTWTKTSNNTQFNFADENGHELALNPGQTWISALAASNKVSYK